MAADEKAFDLDRHGLLAYQYLEEILPLEVLQSGAGWYIGTMSEEGPASRESQTYWRTEGEAEKALASGNWQQKANP